MVVLLVGLGLILGSFVNAVVWRLREQERLHEQPKRSKADVKQLEELSIARGRSMCSVCHHPLAAKDLVPVLSWLALRGMCRYCGKPIQDTPIVELAAAGLFLVSYAFWPLGFSGMGLFDFVLWLVFLTGFMVLGVYDLRWFLLPDRVVFPLAGLAFVEVLFHAILFGGGWHVIMAAGWGVLLISGLFLVLFELSRGKWIGFGDVKLGVVLGLLVGGPLRALLLVFVASLLGSLVAVPMLLRRKARANTQVPFGPFLLTAAVVVVLFGNQMLDWYTGLFYLR